MKQIFAVAICVVLCLTGCSLPTTPTNEPTHIPVETPLAISTPTTDTATTPIPVVAEPESAPDFIGEWAGYFGGEQIDFALDWTWAAKLNIRKQDAWLSLDRIDHVKDTWDLPFIKPVAENAGARLEIVSRDDESIVLSIMEYAYHTGDEPPIPVGTRLTLSYIAVTNEQERSLLTVSEYLVRPYTGTQNDVFEGAVISVDEDKLFSAAFVCLPAPDADTRAFPRWDKELNNLSSGVHGVYTFGETGADNANSSYIFVYADERGYEHIRMTFCWIIGAARQGTSSAFIVTEPVFEFDLSMAGVPYWNTLYELDAASGEFIDVSVKYTDYYLDAYIPRISWFLSGGKPDASADRQTQLSYEAQEEMLRRALTITEGARPSELPPIPELKPNAPSITADVFGDGEPVLIEPCFLTVFPNNAPNYDAVKLRINGEWTHSFLFDDIVDAALYTADEDEGTPGVELAFQLYENSGTPHVKILGLQREGGYSENRSAKLWGILPVDYSETPPEPGTPEPITTSYDAMKRLNLADHYEVISMTYGDFTGDNAQDTAVLYSEGNRYSGIDRFALAIIDGEDGSIYHREIATDFVHAPCLYTVDGPEKKDAILAAFDSGGSGGVMKYFIFDAAHGQIIDLFHQVSRELHPTGVLIDGFKGSVKIDRTDQTFEFSVEGNKDSYTEDAGIYENDGTLRNPDYQIFFDDIHTMKREEVNGNKVFICAQLGSARSHADTVCAVYSQYGYDADGEIVLEKIWLESLAEAE